MVKSNYEASKLKAEHSSTIQVLMPLFGGVMKNWLKTILFVSAFSPTLIVVAGVRFFSTDKLDTLSMQLITIALLGTILPILIVMCIKSQTEAMIFKAKKVESADYFLLVFVASYLSPIAMKAVEVEFEVILLLVTVIFFVAWVISNIPSHPVLYLCKYRFYKIESEDGMVYMLLTPRQINSPKQITSVKKVTSGMLME